MQDVVVAGWMRPRGSFRGSDHSVTSQPPDWWMKMKKSLDVAPPSASARKSGLLANAATVPEPSNFKNTRRFGWFMALPLNRDGTRDVERARSKLLPTRLASA